MEWCGRRAKERHQDVQPPGCLGPQLCGPPPRPHSPRTAQASRAPTASLILPVWQGAASADRPASALLRCAPRSFIPRSGQAAAIFDLRCLLSPIAQSPLIHPLCFFAPMITSFPKLWDRPASGVQHSNVGLAGN